MPGDRVDVVVTYKSKAAGIGMVTKAKTVLEKIEVFATDNIRQGSAVSEKAGENQEINAKNISLLVTPDQYNLLMLAESKGQLTLALRSAGDEIIADAKSVDDLVFEDEPTSHGDSDRTTEGDSSEEGEKTATGDVRKFLNDEQSKTAAKPTPEKKEEKPVVPTWTIRVYDGGELREEKIELQEQPAPGATSEATSGASADKANGKSWKGWLKTSFLGGK
jgi:Flp pilus assembly protein CpaB